VHIYPWPGISVVAVSLQKRWLAAVGGRDAVQRGRAVPETPPTAVDAEELVKSAQKILV
jgi:hypothetical protein